MRRNKRLICGLLVLLLHQAGWANQEETNKVLVEQGNFWLERNDFKRAAEAWNKLLLVSPNDPQALYGLARVELQSNRTAQARVYLERLKQAHAQHPLVARLEQEISLSSSAGASSIADARRLAAEGKVDEAVTKYQQVLGDRPPVGELGREYYTNLGYTQGGLSEAIAGLRRLLEQSPNDAQTRLALGRHLARNEATRIEGIRTLEQLSSHSDLGKQATESWREALTWLGTPSASEQALFNSYLQTYPDDTEIAQQLQQGVRQVQQQARAKAAASRRDPLRERTDVAMKWLEAGDTARARAEFDAVLKQRPNDSEALGGLGIIAMRAGNWQQANDYLRRARQGNRAWQSTLDSVQYWVEVERANSLLQAGKINEARQVAARAAKRNQKEVAANVLLADILLKEGKVEEATKAYRNVLERRPDDAQALQGLGQVARMSGDYGAARRMLEDALVQDPDNPWLRYQLAMLYQDAGYYNEAKGLVDGLLLTHPNDPDALYVSALLASNNQQWQQARQTLDRIPADQRSVAMNELYARANLQAQINEAVRMAKSGRRGEALNWLSQVAAAAETDFDIVNSVAQAYVEIGETARGLALLQPLRAQGQARSVDASIAYAGLLLASGQDVEASIVLRHLQNQTLTGTQRASLNELTDAYRVRQADLLTERKDLVAAYDMLAPVLSRNPNDNDALASLARMYATAGQGEQAVQLYETVLQRDPNNPYLHLGLAQVSQQLRNHRQARNQADIAVSLAPNDIDILTSAAQVYRLSGRTSEAAKLIERAMALQAPSTPNAYAQHTGGHPAGGSANPFVGMPGQRSSSALDAGYATPAPAHQTTQTYPAGQAAAAIPPPVQGSEAASHAPYQPTVPPGASSFMPVAASSPNQRQAVPAPVGRSGNPFSGGAPMQYGANAPAAYAQQSALARELDAIQQERSGYFTGGAEFRSRSGESSTSQLEEFQLPLEVAIPAGDGRIKLRATPTSLSSGTRRDLGPPPEGAEIARLNPYAVDNDTEHGVGLSVGYQGQGFELDAGVTPLGFQETNFVGGALIHGTLDQSGTVGYRFDVSRRPVTDSVLSFAGRTHRTEDLEWGGVTATGARATLSKDFGDAGIYGAIAWHSLRGHNVASNDRKEFNAGAYFRVIDDQDSKLTAGVNLNAVFYDKNLGHYTYGHGGYFSPKHHYALSVPVTWAQRSGQFSYRLDGAIGLQSFKQDEAPVFPTRSDLQAQAVAAGANIPGVYGMEDGVYRGSSKTGVSYNFKASAEYRVAPQLALGATIGADNANDYKQWMGGVYLRYYFHPQRDLVDLPIEPTRTTYGDTFGR